MALREAKQAFDSAEKSREMERKGRTPAPSAPGVGGIRKGVPVNTF